MERAYEFYSPEALRQRWNFLTGNRGFAGAIASSGDPAAAATEQRPGLASSTAAGPANARNKLPEWKDPALQELPPLSHFSEDVRDQIKAIMSASGKSNSSEEVDCMVNEFSDVNAVEDSDSESELSDSMEDTAMSLFGTVNLDKILADLEGKDATLEVESMASEFCNINDGEDSDSESELSDSVEDTAMSLFGTFDLDEILADLSCPEAGAVFSSHLCQQRRMSPAIQPESKLINLMTQFPPMARLNRQPSRTPASSW